jgi:hypothetical protein
VYTTVGDLAKFASFLMGNEPESVLKTASLQHDLDQVIVSSNSRMTEGYGLGFVVRRRASYVAFGHGGDLAGYQVALYINRDKANGEATGLLDAFDGQRNGVPPGLSVCDPAGVPGGA